MIKWKYQLGLVVIVSIVWLTMIACLYIIYFLLPPIELWSITYLDRLLPDATRLLVAGFILLAWLYSWNMLVRLYFRRNLSRTSSTLREGRSRRKDK